MIILYFSYRRSSTSLGGYYSEMDSVPIVAQVISPEDMIIFNKLKKAILEKNIKTVRVLFFELKRSLEPNLFLFYCDKEYGRTLIHYAAQFSSSEILLWLIDNGGENGVNVKDNDSSTPLLITLQTLVINIQSEIPDFLRIQDLLKNIYALLNKGFDLEAVNQHGKTSRMVINDLDDNKVIQRWMKKIDAGQNLWPKSLNIDWNSTDFVDASFLTKSLNTGGIDLQDIAISLRGKNDNQENLNGIQSVSDNFLTGFQPVILDIVATPNPLFFWDSKKMEIK